MAHFVFMLTHGDRTVDNAAEIIPTLADSGLRYIGFKDVGQGPGSNEGKFMKWHTIANTAGAVGEDVSRIRRDRTRNERRCYRCRWLVFGCSALAIAEFRGPARRYRADAQSLRSAQSRKWRGQARRLRGPSRRVGRLRRIGS